MMSDDLKKHILKIDKRVTRHIDLLQELLFNVEIEISDLIEIEIQRIQSLHLDIHFLERSLLELINSNINTRENIEIGEEILQLERQIFEQEYSHYFIIVDESSE